MTYTGRPLKRSEDPRLISGQGSYVNDIKIDGMLHAAILRSPHAHARVTGIRTSVARSQPGVISVLTGADIEDILTDLPTRAMSGEWEVDEFNAPEHPVLARDKVNYVGQTVAVVVAEDPHQARDALELVEVDYSPLPAIVDPLEAADECSTPVHQEIGSNVALRIHHDRQGSDLDSAFAQSDMIVRQRYTVQRLAPAPMETRGLVAHYQPNDGFLTVWASTQSPHRVRRQLAALLGLSDGNVRVIAPDGGAGSERREASFQRMWP